MNHRKDRGTGCQYIEGTGKAATPGKAASGPAATPGPAAMPGSCGRCRSCVNLFFCFIWKEKFEIKNFYSREPLKIRSFPAFFVVGNGENTKKVVDLSRDK